ncbi:beta strand repeat-containing protein [Colwellia psychrerythraea]|uniref:Ig domain protein group 1 domain protein n=1 Tax=Colwellia psychrerythraea TaxID=28229 RepID=A0A099KM34_COLPS|nr:Ig-like domain-containing protein [Colwellia psychrerythraea]KGJ91829.1 Ig domain protein group 1 domain protein [Colwellia psychrerythraea]
MQLLRRLSFTMLLMSMMTLVACGDGDGDLTGDGTTPTEEITLTMATSDGELSAANDITISTTVANNGKGVGNKTVTFSLAVVGSATFDPIAGTATTDANGVATIVVKVTDMKGSVNVIASYESTVNNISFDSAGDGESTGGSSGGAKISIEKSEGDLSAANDIIISASILANDTNEGVAGQLVTFTLNDSAMATLDPAIGTAVTNDSGIATITVKVTDVAGGVEVTASVGTDSNLAVTSVSFTSVGDGVKVVEGEPKAASISLFASSQQLASSGSQSIVLTAIAKDINNNLLEGVTINFSTDSGALGKILDENGASSSKTGPDGKVAMTLSTLDEPSNRLITVTVLTGDISDSLEIEVVGTTLTLTGTSSLALNDEASYIINVLDSDGNGVAKTAVAISLSGISTETPAGNVADITLPTTSSVTTDNEGQATLKVTGTTGGTNSLIIKALNATTIQNVSVQSDSFLFTRFTNGTDTVNPSNTPIVPDVSLAQTASATLTWLRDGAVVADGTSVTFTTTRGVLSVNSATTIDGKVTATLTSNDAGKALVTLVGTDIVSGKAIELTNQLEFEFFASTAATIKAQASPNSIGPNEQTSTISVVVNDANGNLVKNKKIKFVLEDVSGGTIFPATAVTDSNGSASTIYTSNSTSAKDAVSITAVVEDTPAITDTVNLTVANRELFIAIGTGNEIAVLDNTDYIKEYSIFVTDAESNAVANVELTVSAIPENYYKGQWIQVYDEEVFQGWAAAGLITLGPKPTTAAENKQACRNEDANFNGILDAGEDDNSDGVLTPGNKVSISGTFVTDSDGRSVIRIIYSQSYAQWLDINLIVSGKVTGSEGSAQTIFTLPIAAEDTNQEAITPPHQGVGPIGPFGFNKDCSLSVAIGG